MTDVGRNDPCPCGSGRKYKKCCLGRERDAPTPLFLPREVREAAAEARVWQADLVPLPIGFEDDPTARPAALMVTADGFVIGNEVLSRPSAEWDDVARLIDLAVKAAADSVGALPQEVEVRHDDVADALVPLLERRGVTMVSSGHLGELERLSTDLILDLTGQLPPPYGAMPETWAGWGLPTDRVAEIFQAAAALWRAAPWRWIAGEQPVDIELADGREWTVSVLGRAGQEFGLVLYSDPDDCFTLIDTLPFDGPFGDPWGRVLSLSYGRRDELPRPMQREVASAGWEVAAPEAYPMLFTINTPAGGVTLRDAADLAVVTRAVAALPEAEAERLSRGEEVEWRDPATDTLVSTAGLAPDDGPWPGLWTPPERLRPGGPEGPGARPEDGLVADLRDPWPEVEAPDEEGGAGAGSGASGSPPREPVASGRAHVAAATTADASSPELDLFAPEGRGVVDRFESALRGEGLSEATVDRHVVNADAFVEYLKEWAGVPLAAVHEYDLRMFLFDIYPRKFAHAQYRQDAMPASLGRFFRWLAEEEGIECPWAEEVLGEREAYNTRLADFPGGFWWDPAIHEWRAPLYEDLERRVLLHDDGLGTTLTWGEGGTMGLTEAGLDRALQRLWLLWRDDLIRSGEVVPARVRALLVERQREWERTPHPDLDGESPLEAVEKERARRAERG